MGLSYLIANHHFQCRLGLECPDGIAERCAEPTSFMAMPRHTYLGSVHRQRWTEQA